VSVGTQAPDTMPGPYHLDVASARLGGIVRHPAGTPKTRKLTPRHFKPSKLTGVRIYLVNQDHNDNILFCSQPSFRGDDHGHLWSISAVGTVNCLCRRHSLYCHAILYTEYESGHH